METKLEKFERLATKRTEQVCKQIGLIGNLANTSNYEYTKEHVEVIFTAIDNAVKAMKDQFEISNIETKIALNFEKIKVKGEKI